MWHTTACIQGNDDVAHHGPVCCEAALASLAYGAVVRDAVFVAWECVQQDRHIFAKPSPGQNRWCQNQEGAALARDESHSSEGSRLRPQPHPVRQARREIRPQHTEQ